MAGTNLERNRARISSFRASAPIGFRCSSPPLRTPREPGYRDVHVFGPGGARKCSSSPWSVAATAAGSGMNHSRFTSRRDDPQ